MHTQEEGLQSRRKLHFYASKLSIRVVLVGHTCFSIRLKHYRSDVTMFRFNLLDIKFLSDVYIHYFVLRFTCYLSSLFLSLSS